MSNHSNKHIGQARRLRFPSTMERTMERGAAVSRSYKQRRKIPESGKHKKQQLLDQRERRRQRKQQNLQDDVDHASGDEFQIIVDGKDVTGLEEGQEEEYGYDGPYAPKVVKAVVESVESLQLKELSQEERNIRFAKRKCHALGTTLSGLPAWYRLKKDIERNRYRRVWQDTIRAICKLLHTVFSSEAVIPKKVGVDLFLLLQQALQTGPLNGAKPGNFNRSWVTGDELRDARKLLDVAFCAQQQRDARVFDSGSAESNVEVGARLGDEGSGGVSGSTDPESSRVVMGVHESAGPDGFSGPQKLRIEKWLKAVERTLSKHHGEVFLPRPRVGGAGSLGGQGGGGLQAAAAAAADIVGAKQAEDQKEEVADERGCSSSDSSEGEGEDSKEDSSSDEDDDDDVDHEDTAGDD